MIAWLGRLYHLGLSQRTIATMTGIPRSSLYRYERGLSVPSPERIATVREFAWNVQYQHLRYEGASVTMAKRFMRGTIETIDSVVNWIDEWSANIARIYNRSPEEIRLGLAKSKRSIEDIETAY